MKETGDTNKSIIKEVAGLFTILATKHPRHTLAAIVILAVVIGLILR